MTGPTRHDADAVLAEALCLAECGEIRATDAFLKQHMADHMEAANAILTSGWLQRHDAAVAAQARREAAQDIAAAIEARKPHIPVSTDPQRRTRIIQRSTLNQAAALARAAAAAPARRPDTQQGDGDG